MNNCQVPHPDALRFAARGGVSLGVIQKILVIVDPTASSHPCIAKAQRIAASWGSCIELYICDVEQDVPQSWAGGGGARALRAILRERRLEELEELAVGLRLRGLSVTTAAEWHAPLERGIGEHVIRTKPDLVVKDAHPHAPLPHSGNVQTDWILIRQVGAPLLLVRPRQWRSHPTVAVAVDPCHPADRPVSLDETLFGKGCSIAAALTGHVEVLHVLQGPPHLPGEQISEADRESSYERARGAVAALLQRQCPPVTDIHFSEGAMPRRLIELSATVSPDILVIGAAARERHASAGSSTAVQILEQVECDVLIAKPAGYVSPLMVTE